MLIICKLMLFDEDYFMYGEDIDLSYKILQAGYNNYYYGKTSIIHFKGESTLKDANYAKRFYGAMQIFYKKHLKGNTLFNGLVWIGIKLAYSTRRNPKISSIKPKCTYLYSEELNASLGMKLQKPIHRVESFLSEKIKKDCLFIYDLNFLKIKDVIYDLKQKSQERNIVFRFLPKNSKFIIGSDSAIERGKVIHF